jgi:predicted ArsR family transcriptional regulator
MGTPGGRPRYKQAITAISAEHPKWTHQQIADAVGCHRRTVGYHLSAEVRAARLAEVRRYTATEHGRTKRRKGAAKRRKS